MHRMPKNNQWRKDLSEWKGVTWSVVLDVNARMVITHVGVVATKALGEDLKATGYAHTEVAPFDDLRSLVVATLVEAAMNAADELISSDQLALDLDPASA